MANNMWAVCTACGKKQSVTGDSYYFTKPPSSSQIPGKCPNTKDGKHVPMWQPK
jgi:hypothetical protein